jgi:serine/threonine protein kinase
MEADTPTCASLWNSVTAVTLLQAIEAHKKNKSKYTEKQIWHLFIQTVRGLKALHDLQIVHRDIKCANKVTRVVYDPISSRYTADL